MRAYVVTTGILFALLAAVHAWRMAVEGHHAMQPIIIAATVLSAVLAVWAAVVLRRPRAG